MNCDATVPPIAASDSHFMQYCPHFFFSYRIGCPFQKSKEGIIFFASIVNGGGEGMGGAAFSAVMLIVW